jgi:hypothetical protein
MTDAGCVAQAVAQVHEARALLQQRRGERGAGRIAQRAQEPWRGVAVRVEAVSQRIADDGQRALVGQLGAAVEEAGDRHSTLLAGSDWMVLSIERPKPPALTIRRRTCEPQFHGNAAVQVQAGAGDLAAGVGQQVDGGVGHVFGLPRPSGYSLRWASHQVVVAVDHRRIDDARRQRVGAHAARRDLQRQRNASCLPAPPSRPRTGDRPTVAVWAAIEDRNTSEAPLRSDFLYSSFGSASAAP